MPVMKEDDMKTVLTCLVVLALGAAAGASAQQTGADIDRLVQQYVAAWNAGDAKAMTALYADDGMRTENISDGRLPVAVGKQALQAYYERTLGGELKGTRLTVMPEQTRSIGDDVRIQGGSWQVTGAKEGPRRGTYLNTYVRQGGEWKIAAVASVPDLSAMDPSISRR